MMAIPYVGEDRMSTEIEATATRELAASVHALNRTVIRLETLMEQFGPIQAQQVAGLADCTNRVTRLEDRNDALDKRLQDEKEQRDKQIASNRWFIGATFTAVALLITVLGFLVKHITFTP